MSLLNDLQDFLAIQVRSAGGFAPVSSEEYEDLYELIHKILAAKYEPAPDGDYPIEVILVNRNTHERMNYVPIPYAHKIKTDEDRSYLRRDLRLNLQVAFEDFDCFEREEEHRQYNTLTKAKK